MCCLHLLRVCQHLVFSVQSERLLLRLLGGGSRPLRKCGVRCSTSRSSFWSTAAVGHQDGEAAGKQLWRLFIRTVVGLGGHHGAELGSGDTWGRWMCCNNKHLFCCMLRSASYSLSFTLRPGPVKKLLHLDCSNLKSLMI